MFNIIPWNHSSNLSAKRETTPISYLQNEVNRLFEDFFSDFQSPSILSSAEANGKSLAPAVDIVENDKSFKVEVELPGMDQDDVEVTINDNYLTIKGEKQTSKENKDENYIRRERYYGSYQRTIALPETVNADKAKATFNKCILCIDVPKKEEAIKPSRNVDIKEAA